MPRKTRAVLLRFLSSPETTEAPDLPPFDYDTVSKQLLNVGEAQTTALYKALAGRLDDDDAQLVVNMATRVILALKASIPRRVYKSVTTETVMPPEPYALGRWERQWAVAVKPQIVLDDLLASNIDPGMVSTLQQAFPESYKMTLAQLDDAIATMKTRRGDKWDVPETKNRDLKILLGVPYLNFDLAAAYAAAPDPTSEVPKQAPQGGTPPIPLSQAKPDDKSSPEELPGQAAV